MKKLLALVALLWAAPAFATDPQFGAIRVEVAPNIRHAFVSSKTQGTDATKVSKDEWNAAHTAPLSLILSVPTGIVWPAQPAAVTEFCGATTYRWRANLTNYTTIRLTAQVISAGAATSALRLQYTTDTSGATGWDYLDGVSGPSVSTDATGVTTSATVSIVTAAKADVLLRLVGVNGDGVGGTCYSTLKAATATLADSATSATSATSASTAAALASDPADCAAGSAAKGIDASGAASGCFAVPSGTGTVSGTNTGDQTSVTGNAGTATALAANGANCSAGSAPLGVDASGAVEGCFAVPSGTGTVSGTNTGDQTTITGNAGTATALAANGANCSAGNYPLGVDASGAVESCTAAAVVSASTVSTATYFEDAGATDAYAGNLSPAPSAWAAGLSFCFKANTGNTTAATVNPNGLGAKTIKRSGPSVTTDLLTGDIVAGQVVCGSYDGTNFQMSANKSGQMNLNDGSVGSPAITLATAGLTTGWYATSSNSWNWASSGSVKLSLSGTSMTWNSGSFLPGTNAQQNDIGSSGIQWRSIHLAHNSNGAGALIAMGAGGGSDDTFVTRDAAATVQLGLDANGAVVAQTIKAADGVTGSDLAGGNITLAAGRGTGAGAGGNLNLSVSPALGSGTTAQTLESRFQAVAKQLTLTDNTATTFAISTLGNDTFAGGTIHYCVYAADATTAGQECGSVDFGGQDVTAGAGGETCPTPTKVGTPLQVLTGSTLTVTFSATTGTDLCNWRVTADTNIATPVNLYIKLLGVHNSGATFTAQ